MAISASFARVLAAFSAMVLLAACQENVATTQKQPVRVRVVETAVSQYQPVYALTGVIAARTESNLAFRTGGRVLERTVEVGDHVTSDMVLARLDPEEQQADLRAAQASVDAATAQLRQATAAFERQKTLLAQGFTTRAAYDQAEQAMRVAQSSLDGANSRLQTARDALGFTELRAGTNGIVTAANIEPGQLVQAAQTAFAIAADGDRDAVFDLDEALVATFDRPPQVVIRLLSDPSVTAVGIGRELSPVVDPGTGTIRGKITIPDTPPAMSLGAAIAGSMQAPGRDAIILPWGSMFSENGKPAVWVVDAASKAVTLRAVDVISYDSGSVAVASGVNAGEQVVSSGGQLLHPGLVVEIVQDNQQ